MTPDPTDLCVTMVNDRLASAPTHPLSTEYSLRWYVPGDENTWVAIQTAADLHNTITRDLFFQQFPQDNLDLRERQCYLNDKSSKAIATATAWEDATDEYAGFGLVHWMAVLPELQHRGIGKMLMSIVCQRLLGLGYERACLRTSTLRPDAIALYERFGFEKVSVKEW